jgi:hypothetical protein
MTSIVIEVPKELLSILKRKGKEEGKAIEELINGYS